MVSRRRLIAGSAAALGTLGLGIAGATAWASTGRAPQRTLLGGGMPLPGGLCPVDYRSRADWGADENRFTAAGDMLNRWTMRSGSG